MRTKSNKQMGFWAWLPALLVIVGSVITAAGISLIPGATAATQGATVDVTGNVSNTLAISDCDGVSTTGTSALGFVGNFTAGTDRYTNDCTVAFSTNNGLGARLDAYDNDGAAPFFCNNGGASCGANDEFTNVAANDVTLSAGDFGLSLESVSSAAATWAVDGDGNAQNAVGYHLYPLQGIAGPNAGSQACTVAASTNGACVFAFAGEQKAAQNSDVGTGYKGTARFLVTTL